MSKSADAFRTISEVADVLDVQKHVLRFWEVKFPQIRPMKRGGGRRYYRPEDMVLLRGIQHLLHAEGYTIKGVQKILREQGVEQVKIHGLAATALAESKSAAKAGASKSATPAKPPAASPVALAGRVRALPKSGKAASIPQEPQIDYRATIEAAVRELQSCRQALSDAAPTAAAQIREQTAREQTARPAKSARAGR
jgi:DNA-binding transcriptional MerR regulator